MLDRIEDGGQTYTVFQFAQRQDGNAVISLKDAAEKAVMEYAPGNAYSVLVCSSPDLKEGTYTLWSDEKQLAGQGGGMFGGFGMPGMMPGGMMPEGFKPEGTTPPEFPKDGFSQQPPNGDSQKRPEKPQEEQPALGGKTPKGMEGFGRPGRGEGGMWHPGNNSWEAQELMAEFEIVEGGNVFSNVSYLNQEI
jgi:hypothetical protein